MLGSLGVAGDRRRKGRAGRLRTFSGLGTGSATGRRAEGAPRQQQAALRLRPSPRRAPAPHGPTRARPIRPAPVNGCPDRAGPGPKAGVISFSPSRSPLRSVSASFCPFLPPKPSTTSKKGNNSRPFAVLIRQPPRKYPCSHTPSHTNCQGGSGSQGAWCFTPSRHYAASGFLLPNLT